MTVRRVGGTPAQPQRAAKQRKAFEEGGLRHVALKRAESRKAFEEGDLRHVALKRAERRKCFKRTSLLPVHPVFTLSYRHLSAANGIFRLLRNICLGHVYTWMYRRQKNSFL